MIRSWASALSVVALIWLFTGCASVPTDSGLPQVQEVVRQRSGFQIHWNQQLAAEEMVTERIRTLLRKELTVADAVEVALLNNRRLQATFWELGIARADLWQARLVRNPIFGAELRFPDRPFEISLMQSFLDLFQRPKRRKLAAASFESTKLRVADEVLNLVAEVRTAYYTLQGSKQLTEMHRSIVKAAQASADLALRQHEAGNISDLQVENEQALFEQAKLDLVQSESEVFIQRERLNRLMGVWGHETNWELAPRLKDLPPAEMDLEDFESLAVSQRLDLLVAKQEVEAAARALPLARSGAIGEIDVGVHREREPGGETTTGPAIEVPIPVFNRGRAAKARAEALLRQRQERYAALAVEVRSEVRSARNQVFVARKKAISYRDVILPRRSRIVTFSQRQYNFMLIGAFQLLLAKQHEIQAHLGYIEALRDYWIARSELERAIGGSLSIKEMPENSHSHHYGGDRK